jgi:hypothetical protein
MWPRFLQVRASLPAGFPEESSCWPCGVLAASLTYFDIMVKEPGLGPTFQNLEVKDNEDMFFGIGSPGR